MRINTILIALISSVVLTEIAIPSQTFAAAVPIARWSMDDLGGNPRVADTDTLAGQGTIVGANAPGSADPASVDNLWYFSCSLAYTTSTNVPPASMFTSGNSGGAVSYNAGALAGNNCGALIFPQDQYGDEFNFTNSSFTVEMFFKTAGDKSLAGPMELLLHGESCFSYGLILNDSGSTGTVRWAANTGTHIGVTDLTGKNYADGNWHYLVATWDTTNLLLRVANQDGSVEQASTVFAGTNIVSCPFNMLLGRETFGSNTNDGSRTFLGLMDEVQIWSGIPSDSQLLGVLSPAAPPSLSIQSIAVQGNDIKLTWKTSGLATNVVQATNGVGGNYSSNTFATISGVIAIPGSGSVTTNYTDTGGATNVPARYYRVRSAP